MTAAPLISRNPTAADQPLIGIFVQENGREVVRYFTDEAEAEASLADESVQQALSLAGVWGDLDWDVMEADLHRISHSTPPTPPSVPGEE